MAPNLILETAMLLCFGLAWPLASLRMLCLRRAKGPGLLPTALVFCGYLSGMGAKLAIAQATGLPPVFWLYLLNAISVGLNLALQWYFARQPSQAASPVAT